MKNLNYCDTMFIVLEPSVEYNVARMEIVSVYHMVDENQNFRSADCNSFLIRNVYGNNSKFSCSRTKSEAILKGMV